MQHLPIEFPFPASEMPETSLLGSWANKAFSWLQVTTPWLNGGVSIFGRQFLTVENKDQLGNLKQG